MKSIKKCDPFIVLSDTKILLCLDT